MDLNALRAFWAATGLTIRPLATSEQLASLTDACAPFPLPRAVRSYFEVIDGMAEHEWDHELIHFWSLDRSRRRSRRRAA
jgi:hypothetical protein